MGIPTLYDTAAETSKGAKWVGSNIATLPEVISSKVGEWSRAKYLANTASLAESISDFRTDKSMKKDFGVIPTYNQRQEYKAEIKDIEEQKKRNLLAYKTKEKADADTAASAAAEATSNKIADKIKELRADKKKLTDMDENAKIKQAKDEIEKKIKQKNDAYTTRMGAKAEAAATAKGAKEAADKARAEKAAADKKIRDELEKAGKPVDGAPARPRPPQPVERVGDTKKAALNINELFNIQMTLTNLFQYVSFSSPILIVFFITLYSIVQDKILSGLIFNMGIVLISSIVYMLKHLLKNKQDSKASPFCNVLPSPFTIKTYDNANNTHYYYDSPSFSSSVLAFSATYLIYPMIIMNQQNVSLLVVAIVLVLINAVTEVKYGCSGLFGVILGILIGVIFAILYYSLLMSSDHTSKYLYFAEKESNNTQCRKPGTQNFRCSLYKNGVAVI